MSVSDKESSAIHNPLHEKYDTDHEVGDNNVEIMGMDLHNPVFLRYGRHS